MTIGLMTTKIRSPSLKVHFFRFLIKARDIVLVKALFVELLIVIHLAHLTLAIVGCVFFLWSFLLLIPPEWKESRFLKEG